MNWIRSHLNSPPSAASEMANGYSSAVGQYIATIDYLRSSGKAQTDIRALVFQAGEVERTLSGASSATSLVEWQSSFLTEENTLAKAQQLVIGDLYPSAPKDLSS
ncbi:MAG TPA: hypothetical protein VEJ87_01890 [Acidimicrobiales bacterium]|nr:hypothetical protein [Acidimicrobiales bacterium]